MYDVFDQDPTYGIKNPELFFREVTPEFLELWFELQNKAQSEESIFFMDETKDSLDSTGPVLTGWLIPYNKRKAFYPLWNSGKVDFNDPAWSEYKVQVKVKKDEGRRNIVFDHVKPEEQYLESRYPYEIIDKDSWERKAHFDQYDNYLIPVYTLTTEVDITKFLKEIKRKGLSFTLAMSYAVAMALNEVEEFKYRRKGDDIIKFDEIDPQIRYLNQETQLFKDVRVPLVNNLEGFVESAKEIINGQSDYFSGESPLDIVQLSSTPWFSFSSISPLVPEGKDTGMPLIVWGKYSERDNNIILPLSIQVNHTFIDGLHISIFLEKLQDYLNSI